MKVYVFLFIILSLGLATAFTINIPTSSSGTVNWADIIGIPAGFDDGVDNTTAGGGDGNNYLTSVTSTNGSSHVFTFFLNGLPELTTSILDLDTDTVLNETSVDIYVSNNGYITNTVNNSYYLASNPLNFINNTVNNSYYLASNPLNFINNTVNNSYYLASNPSGFITNTVNNSYYLASNPLNFINNTVNTSYYLASNPSGYITNTVNDSYYLKTNPYSFVNQTTATTLNNRLTINCANITGGSDGDYCTDATGGASSTTWVNKTTVLHTTTSNTAWTDLSNLTVTLASNSVYRADCELIEYAIIATTGEVIQVNLTGSPTTSEWTKTSSISATTVSGFNNTNGNATLLDTGSGGVNIATIGRLNGYVVTSGSASTVTFQLRSEVSGSNVGIKRGSFCSWEKL